MTYRATEMLPQDPTENVHLSPWLFREENGQVRREAGLKELGGQHRNESGKQKGAPSSCPAQGSDKQSKRHGLDSQRAELLRGVYSRKIFSRSDVWE